jgi:hypothetical protein
MSDASDQAQALVTGYCGWHVAPSRTETLTLDGSGSMFLTLPSLHVTDIAEVTDRGDTLDTDDYDWSASGLVYRRRGRFSHRYRSVTVTLTHGYDDMPDDVQAVIGQLTDGGIGPQFVQVGQVRVSAPGSNGDAEVVTAASILNRYKLGRRF